MNEKLYLFVFSLSILFAAIIGLVRYKNANASYQPFLWYIFISLANELLVGLLLVNTSKTVQVADWNLFNLFECLVFLAQFYCWQLFVKAKKTFSAMVFVLVLTWVIETVILSTLHSFNYVFLVSYSFVLSLLSIYTINTVVIKLNRSLFKNSMFIICVALVIYFVYTIIVFSFLLIGSDQEIRRDVFEIKVYVNAFVNLLYAVAVYFIPRKTQQTFFFDEARQVT